MDYHSVSGGGGGGGGGQHHEGGQHVCHRCGWPFPNPHPSAKHRRAHKKHCGAVPGYLLAAADDHHDDDDPEHVEGVKVDESGNVADGGVAAGEVIVADAGSLSDDAVAGTGRADDAVEICDLSHGNLGRDNDLAVAADQLERGIQIEDSALLCAVDADASNNDEERSGFLVSKEASLVECFHEERHSVSAQDVMNFPVILNHTDNGLCVGNDINTASNLIDPASDFSANDSKFNKIEEHDEVYAPPNDVSAEATSRNCVSEVDEFCSYSFCAEDKKAGAGQPACGTEDSIHSESFLVETSAGMHLATSDDVPQLENPNDNSDYQKMEVIEDENVTAPVSRLSVENCQFKPRDCEDHESMASSETSAFAGSEPQKEPRCHAPDKEPQEVLPDLTPVSVDGRADDVSTTMLRERNNYLDEPGSRTANSVFGGCFVENSGGNVDVSPYVNDLKNEAESLPKCKATESIASDGMEAHPHSAIKESAVSESIALNEPLTGSCEINVTQAHLEAIETQCSSEAQETCNSLSHQDTSANDMFAEARSHSVIKESAVPEAITINEPLTSSCEINVMPVHSEAIETQCPSEAQETCNSLSHQYTSVKDMLAPNVGDFALADVSDVTEPNEIVEKSELFISEDTHSNDVAEDQIKETIKDVYSHSDSKVGTNPGSDTSELKPPSCDDSGNSGLDKSQELMMSVSLVKYIEQENCVCSRSLESTSGPPSDQIDHQTSVQERFIEVAVNVDTDCSVLETGIQDIISDTSAKECQEELDHQKVRPELLGNISQPSSGKIDQKEDVHETSAYSAADIGIDQPITQQENQTVHNETENGPCIQPLGNYQPVTQSEIQIDHNETESRVSNLPHGEQNVVIIKEDSLDYRSGLRSTFEGPITSPVEHGPCSVKSMTIEESKTSDISEGVVSGTCHESLRDGVELLVSNQQPSAAFVGTDPSLDSNSQSDSIEGQWGSIAEVTIPTTTRPSDGMLGNPPATDSKIRKELHTSKTSSEGVAEFDDVKNMNIFEAPSFMTLVESGSNEIKSMQNPQHESHARTKQEEIIAKVLNWSPAKPHTPLKNLLVEANLESKQRAGYVQEDHHTSSPTKKVGATLDEGRKPKAPTAKTLLNNSSESFSKGDQREWNSPAKLPERKSNKRVKGKPTWVPFICCPSIN